VAYLLDEQKAWLRLRWPLSLPLPLPLPAVFFFGSRGGQHHRHRLPAALRDARLALMHWTRSAKQANVDSMVKLGDYYLAGVGAVADAEKAASCYQAAAEFQQSAQALWNLGWMYENGIGLEQDFHLAKRYYDLALEVNQEAYLPVQLSLIKLRLRSFWNRLTNGRVNSIQDEPGKGENTYITHLNSLFTGFLISFFLSFAFSGGIMSSASLIHLSIQSPSATGPCANGLTTSCRIMTTAETVIVRTMMDKPTTATTTNTTWRSPWQPMACPAAPGQWLTTALCLSCWTTPLSKVSSSSGSPLH
jgi:hypothetical protein